MSKKNVIYQGLDQIPVVVEDTTATSPDYFKITSLPSIFTSGVNTFRFQGNSRRFPEGAFVYVEILDYNGDPIYYEVDLDLESEQQAAVVSVYINEDVSPGIGYIVLCSTLQEDLYGNSLDTSEINLRWLSPIFIDVSKRNETPILYNALPQVIINPSTSSYVDYGYTNGNKIDNIVYDNLLYYNFNDTAILLTSSLSTVGFDSSNTAAKIYISFGQTSNHSPDALDILGSALFTASLSTFSGSGIAYLQNPIEYDVVNSISKYTPYQLSILSASAEIVQSPISSGSTENYFNTAVAYFSDLTPQAGTVSKIRSYYRSNGLGEYIFSNETDITNLETEFGFTPETVTCSLSIPTIHKNDSLDFKFEFINPAGIVSKQVLESINNLFLGGNTYIAGDDNLLTGSLFVSGRTFNGVHISGKANAAMIRSIGYTGFYGATTGVSNAGFVLYSGSIQPLLNSTESYSGVGIELVANSESYFKFQTANGGLLDIRTNKFFIGNSTTFLSSSNNNLEILNRAGNLTKFHLQANGNVTASALIAYTGSSDTTRYLQLDTTTGLVDGKNIGRSLFTQTTPLEINPINSGDMQSPSTGLGQSLLDNMLRSGSIVNPYLQYQPITNDVSFYALPFENSISIFGYFWAQKLTGTGSNDGQFVLPVRFTVWQFNTGSYDNLGAANTSSLASYICGISGSISDNSTGLGLNVMFNRNSATGSVYIKTPFKAVLPLPIAFSDSMLVLRMEYNMLRLPATNSTYGNDISVKIKLAGMQGLIGRTLLSDSMNASGLSTGVPADDFNPF
jgi:hypothetical protein